MKSTKTSSREKRTRGVYGTVMLLLVLALSILAISLRPAPELITDTVADSVGVSEQLPVIAVPIGATEEGEVIPLPPILTELYIDQEGWLWTRKHSGWMRLPFLVEIPYQEAAVGE